LSQRLRSCPVRALLLFGWLPAIASPVATADYAYPLENARAATIIGTPAAYRTDFPGRRTIPRIRALEQ